jgi:hypothetical protein
MKLFKKYKMIVGLSLLVGAAVVIVAELEGKRDIIVVKRPFPIEMRQHVNSMTAAEASDLFCGILLMPKTLLPVLDRFSQHPVARDIKIMPAKIEWENGSMVVIPKKDFASTADRTAGQAKHGNIKENNELTKNPPQADGAVLNSALLYLLLANAAKGKINY